MVARLLALLVIAWPVLAWADVVYVLNSGDATVSMLDSERREEIRRFPMLREPHHLVLSPDERSLLIADSSGNEIIWVNPATGELQRRERISNPYHLAFSPEGRFLVVASLRRDQVDIYDARQTPPVLIGRLRLPDKPSHITFRPDGGVAYVTLQGNGLVAAIDLENRALLWQADVGPEPAGILWHRGKLIVGIMGRDYMAVLNPETRQVEQTIRIGRGAHQIFATPDGRTLWATSRVESRIADIDPSTLTVRRVLEIPGGPDDIAFDADGRLWATLRWVGRVAVIDPATFRVETIRVGRSPHGIYVQPTRGE